MANVFNNVSPLRPGRSVFDLSYEKKLTCKMGQLIPVMCDEVIPGDKFEIGNEVVVRFQPMLAPILHEVNVYVHYFFVPYRILWDDWEDFISGGAQGDFAAPIPEWNPTDASQGSLWDYLGFPLGISPTGAFPIDFVRSSYNRIYNEWYRDQTFIDPIDETNESILQRAWEKDYFTSALPWQQRTDNPPALPITGLGTAVWQESNFTQPSNLSGPDVGFEVTVADPTLNISGSSSAQPQQVQNALDFFNSNTIDFSNASTFDVNDIRNVFQIQKWLERNARTGARYTEFLAAHFGVSPRDDRLQRPEYIGGSKSPVVVSEVLQTSASASDVQQMDTPQANMAGHGISADRTRAASYFAQEFGLIMGIMSIMPRSAYQQGIEKSWLRKDKYEFPFPEFMNLGEQAITNAEIYANGIQAENQALFGYQGRFDELRVKKNMTVAQMRSDATPSLDYWHLSRDFPGPSAPVLNQSFIECVPSERIFAVQDEDPMIVNVANLIRAVRPIPFASNPGLVDHH